MDCYFDRIRMQTKFPALTLICLILFACTNAQNTSIQYFASEVEIVLPQYWKIFAVTDKIILLHGHVKEDGERYSTLFRSENGGEDWVESYRPVVPASEKMKYYGGYSNLGVMDNFEFSFLDSGSGWIISNWGAATYGAVAITIEYTSDFGKNWKRLSEIVPSPQYQFLQASFSDEKHGQIDILYENTLNDRIAYFTTQDGGVTWKETGSLSLRETFWNGNKVDYYKAVDAYIQHSYPKSPYETSFGRYFWKIDFQEDPAQIFIHEKSTSNSWKIIAVFP